ncbi:MAG: PadR family transcriptional regulator [Cryobacterium sp.]
MALLDILILSNLRAGPVHGYELKQRVQRPTVTKLSNNSLYPILRRFEEGGAVTSTREAQEGRPARTIYAITDAGRGLLAELVSTLPAAVAASEEEFLARLNFFAEITPAARHGILDARSAALDARLEQVRTLLAETTGSPARAWRALAMEHLVTSLEGERRWVNGLRAASESGTPPGTPVLPAAHSDPEGSR